MTEHQDPNNNAAVRAASLIATLTHIDNVGFHGIATTLTGASPKIDRNWAGLIRNARIAVAAIAWPDEIQPKAETFAAAAAQLTAALGQRDTTATAAPANDLHLAYHALSDAGWSHLAKIAGLEEAPAHHHGHPQQPH